MKRKAFAEIDMEKTGCMLKYRINKAGYSVKDIQEYLQLACPQPIYRWYNGQILPSVEHLYSISKLLDVHMEQLLVLKEEVRMRNRVPKWKCRVNSYYKKIYKVA